MGKRHYYKSIESLERRIQEHQVKIDQELDRDSPDLGLIDHWRKEIRAFQNGIQRAKKRLGKK
ncbi:hypothetical protein [Sodalinema gerasimenkoae]|uniref:hypothetical protein n=1 Tax=Sodalinema gerasimenkoae TaxID=2862348 RepID=UPI0013581D18|nr:hypothetical protein [Sodalinema gerasimenkoae]